MPKISRIQIIELQSAFLTEPPSLEADLAWVQKRGVDVERVQREVFPSSSLPSPAGAIDTLITSPVLPPLVFVDGNMAISGRYPTREEMGIWITFGFVLPDDRNPGGMRCCTL